MLQSFAVGVEQSLDASGSRQLDQLAVKVRRNAGLDAPADHQPMGFPEQSFDQIANRAKLRGLERRAHFVELYREPLLIGGGQVDAASEPTFTASKGNPMPESDFSMRSPAAPPEVNSARVLPPKA